MTVTRPDGKLAAILFGYACHPTTLSFTKWCGDYPGFAQFELEKSHPGATAMFVNTCGGDQNPLPRRRVELCEKYGHMLADGVEEALKQPLKPVSPGLRTAFEYVDLPYLKVMHARGTARRRRRTTNAIRARWAARHAQEARRRREVRSRRIPYPVHAWRLGKEMLVIGMGAETVVDYALRFKTEFGPGTWVCGYADDMISTFRRAASGTRGATKAARTSTNTAAPPCAGRATSRTASPRPCSGWSNRSAIDCDWVLLCDWRSRDAYDDNFLN